MDTTELRIAAVEVPCRTDAAVRVGLVSDTHLPESRSDLWPQTYRALEDCDLIIHGGDVHEVRFLERLSELAPTFAARGNGEEGSGGRPVQPADHRLREAWLLSVAGALIGVTHDLPVPEYPPHLVLGPALERIFGRRDMDVLVHSHTHVESISIVDSILCVNPGSPTYPHNLTTQLGTLGELTVEEGRVTALIWQLTEDGKEPFHWPGTQTVASVARSLRSAGGPRIQTSG
jgi:uncharacterized protein